MGRTFDVCTADYPSSIVIHNIRKLVIIIVIIDHFSFVF